MSGGESFTNSDGWRDIGNGNAQCDNTKRVVPVAQLRPKGGEHTMTFTPEVWKKLEALAEQRSKGKHKYTPKACVLAMIDAAHVGPPTWVHP